MSFEIKTTRTFLEQIRSLSDKARKLIGAKIDLIKLNPHHFKRIHSKLYSKVFRVRLNLDGKESRLIYLIIEPNIIIACILERKDDYNDLEGMLMKINAELV
ncbi:type II toxin-antitoxin system RelE/ParE family toxin [Candidatus Micrarchaeota archaeon]|nr:type II toxin-antitoxin system RelE/ParE family toxin [Candidatus Micrarchaeota archaeon]